MAQSLITFSVLEFESGAAPIAMPAVAINWDDSDVSDLEETLLKNRTFLSLLFQHEIPDVKEAEQLLEILRETVSWRAADQGEQIQWLIGYELFCEQQGDRPALFMHDLRDVRDTLN
jgi:hypothetical protein